MKNRLHKAIEKGDRELVKTLIVEKKCSPNKRHSETNELALVTAIKFASLNVIKDLIYFGADPKHLEVIPVLLLALQRLFSPISVFSYLCELFELTRNEALNLGVDNDKPVLRLAL